MTDGMKSGAGDNPFADDQESTDESTDAEIDDRGSGPNADTSSDTTQAEGSSAESPSNTVSEGETAPDGLGYIHTRYGVKDDRKMVQYFLKDETQALEKDVQRELESRFNRDVYIIDIREALVRVGANHLDEVSDELQDWGYFRKE